MKLLLAILCLVLASICAAPVFAQCEGGTCATILASSDRSRLGERVFIPDLVRSRPAKAMAQRVVQRPVRRGLRGILPWNR